MRAYLSRALCLLIGGHLDIPESNWVAHELASRGIPVLSVDYTKCLGGVHYPVPVDEAACAASTTSTATPASTST